MLKFLRLIPFILLPLITYSQNQTDEFGMKFTGFVRNDFFYDTRQCVVLREGNFLFYPDNVLKDANGNDINTKPSLNFLAITSRLKANITAPEAFGARISGAIEAEFFGNADADINGLRLRLAFIKMNWKKSEVIFGQYWHPMFITDACIIPISFNTAGPFQPISRHPQIRFSHDIAAFRFMVMAYTERDHTSFGPNYADPSKPIASPVFLKNAAMPDLHLQLQYRPAGKHLIAGAGVDYKSVMPEIYTTGFGGKKYETDTKIRSLSYFGFGFAEFKPVSIRFGTYLSENAASMGFIGGYACSNISDTITGKREWTNISTSSYWIDFSNNNPVYKLSLFAGYTKNLGAKNNINTTIYCSRGANIDYVYRCSPRFTYIKGKMEFSFEMEYTVAAYGTIGKKGQIENSKEVSNFRPLLVTRLNF